MLGSYIHGSPMTQWLERPIGIWKVMGLTPVGGSENSFSEYFDLRTLLHYLHFIQVTSPFINNNKDSYSASIPKFKGALQYREKLNKYLKIKIFQTKNFQTDQ